MKTLQREIGKIKARLVKQVLKKGIYENFGQKEVRHLEDKYHYNDLVYGNSEQREKAQLIRNFDNWCMVYTG